MADTPKNFLALLNGIAKRSYYGETEITDELLKSELFPNISDEAFNALLTRAFGIIKVPHAHGHTHYHCQRGNMDDQHRN